MSSELGISSLTCSLFLQKVYCLVCDSESANESNWKKHCSSNGHLVKAYKHCFSMKKMCRGTKTTRAVSILSKSSPIRAEVCLTCGRLRSGSLEKCKISVEGDTATLLHFVEDLYMSIAKGERARITPGAYYMRLPYLSMDPPREGEKGVLLVVVPNPLRIERHKYYVPEVHYRKILN